MKLGANDSPSAGEVPDGSTDGRLGGIVPGSCDLPVRATSGTAMDADRVARDRTQPCSEGTPGLAAVRGELVWKRASWPLRQLQAPSASVLACDGRSKRKVCRDRSQVRALLRARQLTRCTPPQQHFLGVVLVIVVVATVVVAKSGPEATSVRDGSDGGDATYVSGS